MWLIGDLLLKPAFLSIKGTKTSIFHTKSTSFPSNFPYTSLQHLALFVKLPFKFLFSLKQSYKNQFTGDIRSFCSSYRTSVPCSACVFLYEIPSTSLFLRKYRPIAVISTCFTANCPFHRHKTSTLPCFSFANRRVAFCAFNLTASRLPPPGGIEKTGPFRVSAILLQRWTLRFAFFHRGIRVKLG
jgi:hypothetical protein